MESNLWTGKWNEHCFYFSRLKTSFSAADLIVASIPVFDTLISDRIGNDTGCSQFNIVKEVLVVSDS